MSDCLFCKIVNKEIPANIVYENEHVLAFLDISPVNKGHTLVIPKKHSKNILDIEEQDYVELQKAVRILADKVKSATGACGVNVMQNNEPCAGQVVFHSHIHIIPRHEKDGLELWHGQEYEDEEEMQNLANKISKL